MNGIGIALFVGLVIFLFLKNKKKHDLSQQNGNSTTNSDTTTEASEEDLMRIINKTGRYFMTRKYDDAIKLINGNIDRYEGEQKAQLLNQRGGMFSIKGNNELAYDDFKLAYELDPNVTNLNNFVEVLIKLKKFDEARPVAEQGLKNPNVRGSERKMLEDALNG